LNGGVKPFVALLLLLPSMVLSPALAQETPNVEEDARAVLMIGLFSPDPSPELLDHLTSGGRSVLLFGSAVRTRSRMIRLSQQLHCAAGAPMLVAVDEEPGPVTRLDGLVAPLPDPNGADPAELRAAATALGSDLRQLGINLDLAPVVDVPRGPNPVLRNRTFGSDPAVVAQLGAIFVEALAESRVASAAKHFPGHGLSRTDPHVSVTRIAVPLGELIDIDLAPFRALVDAGVAAVLVAHPIYEAIDPALPASLSPATYELLRNDLGFEGVAITDGLGMRAVRDGRSLEQVSIMAISAGADLLIVEAVVDVERVVTALVDAVETGALEVSRLAEAADRVRSTASATAWPGCLGGSAH
jgi:beta-N-acetylhexosaminidase